MQGKSVGGGNIVQMRGGIMPVWMTLPFFCTLSPSAPYPLLPRPHLLLACTLHSDTLPAPPLLGTFYYSFIIIQLYYSQELPSAASPTHAAP